MKNKHYISFLIATFFFLSSCQKENNKPVTATNSIFSIVPASQSAILFNNKLTFTEDYNPYTFKNFLNGGGVALGDINNDGLIDIYFTGNLVENKLYLNKGDFKFEDITSKAGVACAGNWSTGASFVDLNHDGWLDIYVCKSGKPEGENRFNQLFINNGDATQPGQTPTFTDKSQEYGLDFIGLSIHAAFFDYDKDGDLDCYLLNNSIRSVGAYDIVEGLREIPDEKGGNKLLKNLEAETGIIRFEDVSKAAGIYSSAIGFGLGVSVADLNGDNWDDIFVSNDFFERDYLYINQKNGTFKETIVNSIPELSMGSMGADIADINNDLRPDIFVTEMLPEKLDRYKSKTVFENYNKSKLNRSKGYHNQFGRNVLQYNTGNDQGIPQFLELGRYHGVEATDWSWGALLADFDNNGLKDIFVANGIAKDLLDQDHIAFYNPQKIGAMVAAGRKDVIMTIMDDFPQEKLPNYLYLQDTINRFRKTTFNETDLPSFSNGSAYADLDNDGDLDLVLNIIDEPSRIYKNNIQGNSFLQVALTGDQKNTRAIGAKVYVFAARQQYYLDQHPMRGYQSSVDYTLHFGLGQAKIVDSLKIIWPDDKVSIYFNLPVDSCYHFHIKNAVEKDHTIYPENTIGNTLLKKENNILNYFHQENQFSDFDQNRMLMFFISNEGPKAVVEDITGDGLPELLITGSSGQPCRAFEIAGNRFREKRLAAFSSFAESETCNFIIADFNQDNRKDIFMLNGGSEHSAVSSVLRDQLLINRNNNFQSASSYLNTGFMSSSCGLVIDIDQDGDEDVIVAPRMEPLNYGIPADAILFLKDENEYSRSSDINTSLKGIGMVKDLKAADLDGDGKKEIIFSREYNSIIAYNFQKNTGLKPLQNTGLENVKGIWNEIEVIDVDQDGDLDIVAGNIGLNQRFKNLSTGSLYLFVNDFDTNGKVDLIYCVEKDGQYFPIHLKEELLSQIPLLKKRVLKYRDYAKASMTDLFGADRISSSIRYEVNEYRSGVFINNSGKFDFFPLPDEVQYSEQKAIWSGDLNNDGYPDLIMGGNQYETKPEIGMNAASYGHVLINQQNGFFTALPHEQSGLFEQGQIRDIVDVTVGQQHFIIIFKNGEKAAVYQTKMLSHDN